MHPAIPTNSNLAKPRSGTTNRRQPPLYLVLPVTILSLAAVGLRSISSTYITSHARHAGAGDRTEAVAETYAFSGTLPIPPLDVPVWRPRWLALDEAGNLYVADIAQRLIRVFDPAGKVIDTWREPGPPDTVPCIYFPMHVFYDQAMREPANRKPGVMVAWITDSRGERQPNTGKCEPVFERRSPLGEPESTRILQKYPLADVSLPISIDPASGDVYYRRIGCGGQSTDERCQEDERMYAADRVLVDYRRGLFMYRWAAYHEKPTLTLVDINNMPPLWRAPEYKPIDPLPGRWVLAIAASPLRGVYQVLSIPENPTADADQDLRLDALNQAGEIVESVALPSALGSQMPRRPGGWPWRWEWNLAVNSSRHWAITIADAGGRVSIVMGGPSGDVRAVIPTDAMACEGPYCDEAGYYFDGRLDGRLELVPDMLDGAPIVLDARHDRLLSVGSAGRVRTLARLPKKPLEAPISDGAGHIETADGGSPRGFGSGYDNSIPQVYSSYVWRGNTGGWNFVESTLNGAGYQSFPAPWADGRMTQTENKIYSEFGHRDSLRHRRVALGEERWMAVPERCQILKTDRSRVLREEAVACPYPKEDARQWPDDIALDHERNLLALASREGELSRWTTRDGRFLGRMSLARKGYVRQLRVGRTADGAERLVAATTAGNLDVYDLTSGAFVAEIPVQRYGLPAQKLSYAMDERGRIFVADDAAQAIDVYGQGDGAPAPTPTAAPTAAGCQVVGRKLASPSRVTLGKTVTMRLGMQVRCADAQRPSGVDLVLMAQRGSPHVQHVQRVDTAARTLLGTLDWTRDRVTLLIDGRTVITASSSLSEVMAPLLAMEPVAQATRPALADVLSRAEAGLASSGRADALPVLLLLGDVREDETDLRTLRPIIQRLTGKGILRFILVLRPGSSPYLEANLNELAGGTDKVWMQPQGLAIEEAGDRLQALVNGGIAGGVSVVDALGDTMSYEDGSALPAAVVSADRGSLYWQLPLISADGLTLTYQLRPQALGRHATNRYAELRYRDGQGLERSFIFEQPWIEVLAPTATPSPTPSPSPEPTATPVRPRVYLPLLRREHCADFGQAVDLVLVVDASSSMAGLGPDGRSRLDAARQASASLLEGLGMRPGSVDGPRQVAIVSFASEARLVQPLTTDRQALDQALAALTLREGSRIDMAMQMAHDEVQGRRHRREAGKAVVLLSDGQVDEAQARSAIAAAEAAKAEGVSLFAIALGGSADQSLLAAMASPGQHYVAPEPAELLDIFRRIAQLVRCR